MGAIDFSHGGNIYEVERKYNREIIDFSANINPLGLPGKLKETLYKNFGRILHYPDPDATNLVKKIANYWGISKRNVLLGSGSAELIYLIVATFRPKTTLIPVPTFSEYERAAKSTGSKVSFLKLKMKDGFRLNLSSVNKTDMFFLCHPNNPTGSFLLNNPKTIEGLANKLVVIDEAFMDFLPSQRKYTSIKRATVRPKVVVLRTFTKMFALPGLRIGYIVGHRDTIEKLKKHTPPWNTNSLAQLAAELTLEDKEYIKKSLRLIESERNFLFNEIAKVKKLIPYPSFTNFLLIRLNDRNLTSSLLKERLLLYGILIRDCANFRGLNNKFIRVAVRSHRENLKLIKALKEVL